MSLADAGMSWPEFSQLRPSQQARHLRAPEGCIQSFLFSQQIDRRLLDELTRVADHLRAAMADTTEARYVRTLLDTRSVALYFTQASTRTFTSFSLAAQALGMATEEIRDPNLSSMSKGESEMDTLLTLASLSDVIVMRQNSSDLTHKLAHKIWSSGLATRVINAGSGMDQHPTQALLEVYTLQAHLDLAADRELCVTFVGDLKRSRTARSLSYLLALYPKVRQLFVAPEGLQIEPDLQGFLREHEIRFEQLMSLDDAIERGDAFYMMRIQDEYGETSQDLRHRYERYYLDTERVARMKRSAIILHPLPRRGELPIEIDSNPRAKYWEAITRGKFIRMALLLHMHGLGDVERLRARGY